MNHPLNGGGQGGHHYGNGGQHYMDNQSSMGTPYAHAPSRQNSFSEGGSGGGGNNGMKGYHPTQGGASGTSNGNNAYYGAIQVQNNSSSMFPSNGMHTGAAHHPQHGMPFPGTMDGFSHYNPSANGAYRYPHYNGGVPNVSSSTATIMENGGSQESNLQQEASLKQSILQQPNYPSIYSRLKSTALRSLVF